MKTAPRSLRSRSYPKFIRESKVFKTYKRPFKIFPKIGLENSVESIKKYNENFPIKGKICFSSDGDKGYWDIATMSMRGIKSCMRWNNINSIALVGSLADPYAGIIYIRSNQNTKYGKKMLARAVVRFVVNKTSFRTDLLIEDIYYSSNKLDRYENEINNLFVKFLKEKTSLEVINTNVSVSRAYDTHFIPTTKQYDLILKSYKENDARDYLSYRDCRIRYHNTNKFYNPKKLELSVKK